MLPINYVRGIAEDDDTHLIIKNIQTKDLLSQCKIIDSLIHNINHRFKEEKERTKDEDYFYTLTSHLAAYLTEWEEKCEKMKKEINFGGDHTNSVRYSRNVGLKREERIFTLNKCGVKQKMEISCFITFPMGNFTYTASGGKEKVISIYDHNFDLIKALKDHKKEVVQLYFFEFEGRGRLTSCDSEGVVNLYSTLKWDKINTFYPDFGSQIKSIEFIPNYKSDKSILLLGSAECQQNNLKLIDLSTTKELNDTILNEFSTEEISYLKYLPFIHSLVIVNNFKTKKEGKLTKISIFNIFEKKFYNLEGHNDKIKGVFYIENYSPENSHILITGDNSNKIILSKVIGENQDCLEVHKVLNIQFNGKLETITYMHSKLVVIGFNAKLFAKIMVYDLEIGVGIKTFDNNFPTINSICYLNRKNPLSSIFAILDVNSEVLMIDSESSENLTSNVDSVTAYHIIKETFKITQNFSSKDILLGFINGQIQLWTAFGEGQFELVSQLKGHSERVSSLAKFDNVTENYLLVSSSFDNRVKVWDITLRKCLATFTGYESPLIDTQLFKIKNRFYTISTKSVKKVNDRIISQFFIKNTRGDLSFSFKEEKGGVSKLEYISARESVHNKPIVVTSDSSQLIKLWSIEDSTGEEVAPLLTIECPSEHLLFIPREENVFKVPLIIGGGKKYPMHILKLFNADSGEEIKSKGKGFRSEKFDLPITDITFIKRSESKFNVPLLVICIGTGVVEFWDMDMVTLEDEKERLIFSLKCDEKTLTCIKFIPATESGLGFPVIAAGTTRATIILWNLENEYDNNSGSFSGKVIQVGKEVKIIKKLITNLVFIKKEENILNTSLLVNSDSEGSLTLWDLENLLTTSNSEEYLQIIQVHSKLVCSMILIQSPLISNNSPILATSSGENVIKLWDVNKVISQKGMSDASCLLFSFYGHKEVKALKYLPDTELFTNEPLLISAGICPTLKIRDLLSLPVETSIDFPSPHKNFRKEVYFMLPILKQFSGLSSNILATTNLDHTIKLWNLEATGSIKEETKLLADFPTDSGEIPNLIFIPKEDTNVKFPLLIGLNKEKGVKIWKLEECNGQITPQLLNSLVEENKQMLSMHYLPAISTLFNIPLLLVGNANSVTIYSLNDLLQKEKSDFNNHLMFLKGPGVYKGEEGINQSLEDFKIYNQKSISEKESLLGEVRCFTFIHPQENSRNIPIMVHSSDNFLKIWDFNKIYNFSLQNESSSNYDCLMFTIKCQENDISSVIFIPPPATINNIPILVTAGSFSDNYIKLFNLEAEDKENSLIASFKTKYQVSPIYFLPAESSMYNLPLLISRDENTISIWDLNSLKDNYESSLTYKKCKVAYIALCPSLNPFENKIYLIYSNKANNIIEIVSLNKWILETRRDNILFGNSFVTVPVSGENLIAAVDPENTLRMFELPTFRENCKIENVHFLQRENFDENEVLITSDEKKMVKIIRCEDLVEMMNFDVGFNSMINFVSKLFSDGDNMKIGFGSLDGEVKIFDLYSGTCLISSTHNNYRIASLSLIKFGLREIYVIGDIDGVINYLDSKGVLTYSSHCENNERLHFSLVKTGTTNSILHVRDKTVQLNTLSASVKFKILRGEYTNYFVQEMNY